MDKYLHSHYTVADWNMYPSAGYNVGDLLSTQMTDAVSDIDTMARAKCHTSNIRVQPTVPDIHPLIWQDIVTLA